MIKYIKFVLKNRATEVSILFIRVFVEIVELDNRDYVI